MVHQDSSPVVSSFGCDTGVSARNDRASVFWPIFKSGLCIAMHQRTPEIVCVCVVRVSVCARACARACARVCMGGWADW